MGRRESRAALDVAPAVKVYLAGPDVFRPDVQAWAASARALCRRHGFEPLTPVDHDESEAPRIFQANLDLIRAADAVVANLDPFRGCEPDSGTCVEIGYALALGKKICGYIEHDETLRARVNRIENGDPARVRDNRGMTIENFGLPLNLMLAVPAMIVEGGLEECLEQLRGGNKLAATARLPENPLARSAIEAAVRYLRWAEDGRIADSNAIATVASQYKVREGVVREWIEAWSGVALASGIDCRPDDIARRMKIGGRQFRSL
ncbi:MAG: nucleoside 2-deoxyribosyltransferase [Pseudomonadota bacterium]